MPDWSIKIAPPEQPTTDEPASFAPDLIGGNARHATGNPGGRHCDLE